MMERLTQFNESYYEIKDDKGNLIAPKYSKLDQVITKLGKLEDLEQELGCPIEVLFKAIKNEIYVYDVNSNCRKVIKEEPTFILDKEINKKKSFGFVITGRYIYLKDYGKTWALTKEELK